jgi:pimeloyl-ACP methyl ester carboxylesterase
MTAVLVHGVPETERLWDALRGELKRDDVVAVSLPGFGRPRPDGFTATKDAYVDWLIGELEGLGEPVDLVGHDWGGGLTLRLVSLRPDLVRTWATDAAGLADVEFEWHEFAKIWQTPDEGEAFMEGWLAAPLDARAATFASASDGGEPSESVMAMVAAIDHTMTDAILALYRSATAVHSEWGPAFVDIPKPGLALVPTDDPFLEGTRATRSAERAGARVVELPGQGHWWMLGDPAGAARVLETFWSSAV